MQVAPWLSEPTDLDEAYGLKRKAREVREDGKHKPHKPPMQPAFRERVRSVEPYRDIVEQVDRNCHGRGGVRRSFINAAMERKSKDKTGRRPAPLTPMEEMANTLATSRCHRYAKGTLSSPDQWPKASRKIPEVCFVGRSNVGKSSLLNKVSQFGTVAGVSPMPGKTKHVSWFRNRKVGLDVLDMPGYGHADRAKVFGPAALEFVKQRTSLKCLYVLIDARHGFKKTDHEWLYELGSDGPMKQIVITKCDLVAPKKLIRIASIARSDLEAFKRVEHKLLLCSSVTEAGVHDLRVDIVRRCGLLEPKWSRGREPDIDSEPTALELPGRMGRPALPSRKPPPVHTHHQRGGAVDIDEILDFSHLEKELYTLRDKSQHGLLKRKGSGGLRR
uniref:EngB-type G domain-containing protein n=1 Tax=Alexandrium catenella TaxID=2925 RepID=A0A7S1QLK2_ALECA